MFLKKLFTENGLEKITIDKVEVKENKNTVKFNLLSQEIIDFNAIENIENQIRNRYNNTVDIEIYIKYELNGNENQANIEKVADNIFYIISNGSNMLSKAKDNIKLKFKDDCFYIIAYNQLLIDELIDNNIEKKLMKIMLEYNLTYKIKAIYQEAEGEAAITAQRIFDEELQKKLEVISSNSTEKKPADNSQNSSYRKRPRKKIDFNNIPLSDISDITNDSGLVKIKGRVVKADKRELKTGTILMTLSLTDAADSITCKYFCPKDFNDEGIEKGKYLQVAGNVEYDDYEKELIVKIQDLQITSEEIKRMDDAKEKRIELHLHTGMSSMDGIKSFKEYAAKAKLGS